MVVILDVDESGSTAKPNTVCCQMEAGTVHSSSVQAGASTPMPTRPNPPSQAHTALCGVTQSYLPVVPAYRSRRRGWTLRAATLSLPQSPNADEEQHTSQVKSKSRVKITGCNASIYYSTFLRKIICDCEVFEPRKGLGN